MVEVPAREDPSDPSTQASEEVKRGITVHERLIAGIVKNLSSRDAISVKFEKAKIKDRFIVIDSRDGNTHISMRMYETILGRETREEPFRKVKVSWLYEDRNEVGDVEYVEILGDFPHSERKEDISETPQKADKWKAQGGVDFVVWPFSPTVTDEDLTRLAEEIEAGIYNKTLTDNALKKIMEPGGGEVEKPQLDDPDQRPVLPELPLDQDSES